MRLLALLTTLSAQAPGSKILDHALGLGKFFHPSCSTVSAPSSTLSPQPSPSQPHALIPSSNDTAVEIFYPDSWHRQPQMIPAPLQQFIAEMASSPGSSPWLEEGLSGGDVGGSDDIHGEHGALVARQQGGVGGGAGAAPPQPPPAPTQLSPVTVYQIDGSAPITYSQVFTPTPVPWTPPQSGSVGLGNITGSVGVVKHSGAANDRTSMSRTALSAAVVVVMLCGFLVL